MGSNLTHTVADALTLPRKPKSTVVDESRDIHEIDFYLGNEEKLRALLRDHPVSLEAAKLGPRRVASIRGMGTIFDYRHLAAPSGPAIRPLVFVQHIPVVRQMAGSADFDVLLRVLQAQGLMVQAATDADGNVAFYTNLNEKCWQARGANSLSCGTEHMHANTSEPWTREQFNAAAWLVCRAYENHDIPMYRAWLTPGDGLVGVRRRGQTSHMEVSDKAGFHDRTDPGPGYIFDEIRDRARRYHRNHRF